MLITILLVLIYDYYYNSISNTHRKKICNIYISLAVRNKKRNQIYYSHDVHGVLYSCVWFIYMHAFSTSIIAVKRHWIKHRRRLNQEIYTYYISSVYRAQSYYEHAQAYRWYTMVLLLFMYLILCFFNVDTTLFCWSFYYLLNMLIATFLCYQFYDVSLFVFKKAMLPPWMQTSVLLKASVRVPFIGSQEPIFLYKSIY